MITCEHCGHEIIKYEVVKYSIKYLEDYLSDYFQRPIEDARNKHITPGNKKNIKFQRIYVYVLLMFGRVPRTDLVEKYKIPSWRARNILEEINYNDPDFIFIQKDLSHNLPRTTIAP